MSLANDKSCQPCGCDEGANYLCQRHLTEQQIQSVAEEVANARHVTGVVATPVNIASLYETRIVDPLTGGEKGQKLQRFDLIPNEFEVALATHYGRGATKYADRNWERGYRWSLSVGALRRHLAAWLDGESIDRETGSNHLIAAAWHCVALFVFEARGLGTDDIRRKE